MRAMSLVFVMVSLIDVKLQESTEEKIFPQVYVLRIIPIGSTY